LIEESDIPCFPSNICSILLGATDRFNTLDPGSQRFLETFASTPSPADLAEWKHEGIGDEEEQLVVDSGDPRPDAGAF
jgi:hypothetical protein